MADDPAVKTWRKRWDEAASVKEQWEKDYRIAECYQYWRGNQLVEPFDSKDRRRIQVNRVHPSVRQQIPSLYFYRPFGRVTAVPERADTPGETVSDKAQLLQDTGAYFVRDKDTQFRPQTFLALKESFWSIGCIEVGYSSDFTEAPAADRPPLKEDEQTKIAGAVAAPEAEEPDPFAQELPSEDPAVVAQELADLKSRMKGETFYVKRIPAKQVMCSASDNSVVANNDWVGYWEDFYLEDVKKSPSYKNTKNLKASGVDKPEDQGDEASRKVRLYKIWDLRTGTKLVLADGHFKFLMKKPFKRSPLFFLRPDVDPLHFWPIPPIYGWLGTQDEYNESRQFLSANRRARVPRFTYDEDATTAEEVQKFESDAMNICIARKGNTTGVFEAVAQPNLSDSAIATLTLSKQEFDELSGIPSEARQTTSQKTATQAVIQNTAKQVADSFDRSTVSDWLGAIIEEIILTAVDMMLLPKWIQVNVDPDSPVALMAGLDVAQKYMQIKQETLSAATTGLRWQVIVDVESLSPVSEEQTAARMNQTLAVISNPAQAILLSQSPELTKRMLDVNGIKSGRDQGLILKALQAAVAIMGQMGMGGANTGVTSLPGAPQAVGAGGPPQGMPEIEGVQ